jgi:hypothetical protein
MQDYIVSYNKAAWPVIYNFEQSNSYFPQAQDGIFRHFLVHAIFDCSSSSRKFRLRTTTFNFF